MKLNREWVTPIATGAFLLSAVTGILLFFKIQVGASKFVHEWLSWVLVGGALLHVAANINAFKYHLSTRIGQVIIGLFVVALLVSFVPSGNGGGEPPFMPPLRALSQAPLSTLAQLAKISPEQLRERLAQAGVSATTDQQSLSEIAGNDMRKQISLLGAVFGEAQ